MRLIGVCLMLGAAAFGNSPPKPSAVPARAPILPLAFEQNTGQSVSNAPFITRGPVYTVALGGDVISFALPGQDKGMMGTASMRLVGANPRAAGAAIEPTGSVSNYLIGADPKKWRTNVPTYGKVRFKEVYPGIDVVYYGNQNQLEYDFEVAPGADLAQVRLKFESLGQPSIDSHGDLVLAPAAGVMKFRRPVAYQQRGTARRVVAVNYLLHDDGQVGFTTSEYDKGEPLVVDPVLVFGAGIGGNNSDFLEGTGNLMDLDSAGNIYIAGNAGSYDFPMVSPYQPSKGSGWGVFVSKLSSDGSTLIYSTYLGGSGSQNARGIRVDAAGNIYVSGATDSADFPIQNAAQSSYGGSSDGFLTKLNSSGNALVYSTYLGGSAEDRLYGLAVDPASGVAVVVGSTFSNPFPTTPGAFITSRPYPSWEDGYVAKYSANGNLVYSSLIGASNGATIAYSVLMDGSGATLVAGNTGASNFPTTAGAYQTSFMGGADAFLLKMLQDGSNIAFSTLLGGGGHDQPSGMAIDSSSNLMVAGITFSSNFPTTPGALDASHSYESMDGFVSKISADGTALLSSTYYGGAKEDSIRGVAVDAAGNIIIGGKTYSPDLISVNPLQAHRIGVPDPMYLSFNGGSTWSAVANLHPDARRLSAVATSPSDPNRLYGSTHNCRFYKSTDRGVSWQETVYWCMDENTLIVHPTNSSTVYSGRWDGVSVSTDGGTAWNFINNGLPPNPYTRSLAISTSNPDVLYTTGGGFNGVYKSTNAGASWANASGNLPAQWVEKVWVSPTSDLVAYAGVNGIYKTTDGGATWNYLHIPYCCNPRGFSPHPSDGNILYYAGSGFFSVSANGGSSWASYPVGVMSSPTAIAVNRAIPSEIYLGFETDGIYKSTDGGMTWSSVNGSTLFRQDRVVSLAVAPGAETAVLVGFDMLEDGFVAKLNPTLSSAVYSSYYGAPYGDSVSSLAVAGNDVLLYGGLWGDGKAIITTPGAYSTPTRMWADLYVAKISDGDGGCISSLTPSSTTADYYGGNGRLRVVTGGGCAWNVTASPAWLNVSPTTSGSGLGLVEFSYGRNDTGAQRTGNVTVNGQSHSITQPAGPACTIYSVSQPLAISSAGYSSSYSIYVSVSSGCQWSATSDSPWLTITSPVQMTGSGNIAISATANAGASARTANIAVASLGGVATGSTKVYQSGSGCSVSLANSSGAIGSAGGTVTVDLISSPSDCVAWQASSSYPWAYATGTTTGIGTASVSFTVMPNPWDAPRVAILNMGGLSYTLTQAAGAACSLTGSLTPLTPVNGSLSNTDCASQVRPSYFAKQYSFNGLAGQRVALEAWSTTTRLPYLALIGPNGALLSSSGPNMGDYLTARLPTVGYYLLPVDGVYRVEISNYNTNTFGDYTLRLLPECNVTLSQVAVGIPAAGGSADITASAPACTWAVTNFYPSWVNMTSPLLFMGNGQISINVAANTGSSQRWAYVAAGGQYLVVSQAGTGSSFSFTPSSVTVPAAGVSNQTVTVTGTTTSWYPFSSQLWLTVNNYSTGSGTITYTVQPNSGEARSAHIFVGNDAFTVNQESGGTCVTVPSVLLGVDVLDYISSPTAGGVRLLVGWNTQARLQQIAASGATLPLPAVENQKFCGTVTIAPGVKAEVFVPTAAERNGDYSQAGPILYDPLTKQILPDGTEVMTPFPGSIVPASRLQVCPGYICPFAWKLANLVSVVRPQKIGAYQNGTWILDKNGSFGWDGTWADRLLYWSLGRPGEIPVVGDWNGDGKQEIGLYVDGTWQLDYNGNGLWDGPAVDRLIFFGGPGFKPYVGDWNGDGRDDVGAYQNGAWILDWNGNFQWDGTETDRLIYWSLGRPNEIPILGDWNGDGKTKLGLYVDGTIQLDYNGNGIWEPGTDKLVYYGGPGFTPYVGDWNGSGTDKVGAYQAGTWILDWNGNYAWDGTGTDKLLYWSLGRVGEVPLVGDWSGDGQSKIGLYVDGTIQLDYNGNGLWDLGTDKLAYFGGPGQKPIVGKW